VDRPSTVMVKSEPGRSQGSGGRPEQAPGNDASHPRVSGEMLRNQLSRISSVWMSICEKRSQREPTVSTSTIRHWFDWFVGWHGCLRVKAQNLGSVIDRNVFEMTEKTSHFGQNVGKYNLMNTGTASFNETVRQKTEFFQQKITEMSRRKRTRPGYVYCSSLVFATVC